MPIVKQQDLRNLRIGVVIAAYRVSQQIFDVIGNIGQDCSTIYVVDDACPEKTGQQVLRLCTDPRVRVIELPQNLGVGGAVMSGYRQALADGADIVVKVDGDGQMNPRFIPTLIAPIINGDADYTKGNRFFETEHLRGMPFVRLLGNAVLSFIAKLSTGYWVFFDPTNGFTAIHTDTLRRLPVDKISQRYFFESDMLFHLNLLRAVVLDVPMPSHYGDEKSNLVIRDVVFEFMIKHGRNFVRRIFYNYYLRGMSLASLELPSGAILLIFGVLFGSYHWYLSAKSSVPASSGTVMLSVLPIILGLQMILAFFAHDIASVPQRPLQRLLHVWTGAGKREFVSETNEPR